MTQYVGLNQAQMDFLRLLAYSTTEEEVKEHNDVVCEYYVRKIDEEMDKFWDEGKWNNEMIEETLHEHLRTPYNAKSLKDYPQHRLPPTSFQILHP